MHTRYQGMHAYSDAGFPADLSTPDASLDAFVRLLA